MDINCLKNTQDENERTKLFMSLVLASQRKLYLYILSLVLYPSDADDLLQDSWC